ncbi:uncharacterized protein LOC129613317 [Condylostylus longicornis]|uniref:uncharacterized protein LOC129613317 n=1 Tax=Condylostylus longicornis TaxID=2530218 RepID=UPI00244E2AC3|nr:uncharacterized protein LOC129613317 [Condylostylus longicornis]
MYATLAEIRQQGQLSCFIMDLDQLKTIAIIGLINGAVETEKKLEKYLTDKVADLVLNNVNLHEDDKKLRIEELERIIERDRYAIKILGIVLDYATHTISSTEYRNQLKKLMREHARSQKNIKRKLIIDDNDDIDVNQIDPLKKSDSTEFIFDEYQAEFAQNRLKRKQSILRAKNLGNNNSLREAAVLSANSTTKTSNPEKLEAEKQERERENQKNNDENFDSLSEEQVAGGGGGGGGGGLPGLIASLSGGEEGSDIGALLGAITGLVSQLFGPGGLDVPSLISSGTSLVAGLLGGGKNFGTVLGEYIGLALDGFSGGGGADPDNEDGPPKPGLFIRHFVRNFMKAKNRMPSDSSEENDNGNDNGGTNGGQNHSKNSDSFSFLKHIVSAIAGGITSFILNASLGSSSGSSKGSASLSSTSSNSSSDLAHKHHH